ncbi:nucleotidyltransferase domain-containing protein [Halomonas sp. 141]|uniref:DUF427 domain-containing protein n=1 Tax=Halomonas sp. 141 TaxID=2056666 RepID=UPI000C2A3A1F|nr:DUF427 domain-containing protein [Halomonas sp. 141]PJX14504.1 nucleotidyltransferase domain-containing protein [Halomonas sp. 141]
MQNARITLHLSKQRMQVRVDGILLADSTNTLELREQGYPPRHYFPREDVRMDLLTTSETITHCPFKGHTVYFSLCERRDIAWSYEAPIEGMEAIAGRVAFYEEVSW